MIQLKDINKTYNNGAPLHVLKGINLDIQRGEFVSIMGASGSGKSTLLNALLNEDKAIVSDIHGTTRDVIEDTININAVSYTHLRAHET